MNKKPRHSTRSDLQQPIADQLAAFADQLTQSLTRAVSQAVAGELRRQMPPRLDGDPSKRLTVQQVAAILSCTEVHVADLIDEGLIEAVDIASPGSSRRLLRIEASSLNRFLDK